MKPSEVLKQFGWQQIPNGENGPGCCAYVAIYRAYGMFSDDEQRTVNALQKQIGVDSLDQLFNWNDDPNRTKEEVIAAFEAIGE